MTEQTPAWMQGNAHPAEIDRLMLAALVASEGVVAHTDLLVTWTSGLNVSIAAGWIWIASDSAAVPNMYSCYNNAAVSKTVTTNGAGNPRKTIVVAALDDNFYDASGFNRWRLTLIDGTAAASPVDPATPANAIKLASIHVPTSNVISQSSITDFRPRAVMRNEMPVGIPMPLAGTAAPLGTLLCNGQAVSRQTYKHLFDVMGTAYGTGDGSTTFNLPDLRGRVPVGLDNIGGSDAGRLDVANTLGGTGGEQKHTLTQAELPAISTYAAGNTDHVADSGVGRISGENTGGTGVTTAGGGLGSGTPHNVMQPYQLFNYCVRY